MKEGKKVSGENGGRNLVADRVNNKGFKMRNEFAQWP